MNARRVQLTVGDKLFDLANLAAAALIFGKFLDPARVPDTAMIVGGIAFVGCYVLGGILVLIGSRRKP